MGVAKLNGVFAKLQRADEHIHAIDDEIRTFALQHAHTTRVNFKYEEGWYVLYVDPIPAFPERVALIAGDCLTNIRAALDHLVWQLVLREDKEPSRSNCFPICEKPKNFPKTAKSALDGIPINGDAWTLIKRAQPFNSSQRQDHPLTMLTYMVNVDKHHTVLAQHTFLDPKKLIDSISWKSGFQPVGRRFPLAPLSCEHPTEVARFQFSTTEDPGMNVEGNLFPDPSIGDIKTQASLGLLNVLIRWIRQLLQQFQALPRVQI